MATKVGVETTMVELPQHGRMEFAVEINKKKVGRIRISRRGVGWASRGSKYELSWKEFGAIMEERGKKTAR